MMNKNVVGITSVLASTVTIFMFLTGKESLPAFLDSDLLNLTNNYSNSITSSNFNNSSEHKKTTWEMYKEVKESNWKEYEESKQSKNGGLTIIKCGKYENRKLYNCE